MKKFNIFIMGMCIGFWLGLILTQGVEIIVQNISYTIAFGFCVLGAFSGILNWILGTLIKEDIK